MKSHKDAIRECATGLMLTPEDFGLKRESDGMLVPIDSGQSAKQDPRNSTPTLPSSSQAPDQPERPSPEKADLKPPSIVQGDTISEP